MLNIKNKKKSKKNILMHFKEIKVKPHQNNIFSKCLFEKN